MTKKINLGPISANDHLHFYKHSVYVSKPSYQESFFRLPSFIFQSHLNGTLVHHSFFIQKLSNFLQRLCKEQI